MNSKLNLASQLLPKSHILSYARPMSDMKPVRGTHDLIGENLRKHLFIIETARKFSQFYGCDEIATPIFESTTVFKRTLGDSSDIVNKEMYTFPDRGGDELTLRPEGTASIARAFISNGLSQQTPLKLFYNGPMFRYERPQKGRQRQFHQLGVEFLGVSSEIADAEVISMAYNILCKLGLKKNMRLEVNSIGDNESRSHYRAELVKYLTQHSDQLSEDSQRRLKENPLRILDSKDQGDQIILKKAPILEDFLNPTSKAFYLKVLKFLDDMAIPYIKSPQLVRGLDYYNHVVFEFKTDDLGAQDTLLSGGRYDHLIESMGGPATPSVGFAAGIERLALLIDNNLALPRPAVIVPLGTHAQEACVQLCHNLRSKGFFVEMSYSGNMSKRMKKANNMNAKVAIIIGDDELAKGEASVKDFDTGAQTMVKILELDQSPFLTSSF